MLHIYFKNSYCWVSDAEMALWVKAFSHNPWWPSFKFWIPLGGKKIDSPKLSFDFHMCTLLLIYVHTHTDAHITHPCCIHIHNKLMINKNWFKNNITLYCKDVYSHDLSIKSNSCDTFRNTENAIMISLDTRIAPGPWWLLRQNSEFALRGKPHTAGPKIETLWSSSHTFPICHFVSPLTMSMYAFQKILLMVNVSTSFFYAKFSHLCYSLLIDCSVPLIFIMLLISSCIHSS